MAKKGCLEADLTWKRIERDFNSRESRSAGIDCLKIKEGRKEGEGRKVVLSTQTTLFYYFRILVSLTFGGVTVLFEIIYKEDRCH